MATQEPPLFDAQIGQKIGAFFQELLEQHPEIRTLAAVIDYRGALNDAPLLNAVWRGRDQGTKSYDSISGSIAQTLALLHHQVAVLTKSIADQRNLLRHTAEQQLLSRRMQNEITKENQDLESGASSGGESRS